mgnify:CR=1 FL=1
MNTITAQQLKSVGACQGQIDLFRGLYGDKTRVTVKKCAAVADKFSWDWATRHLLTAPALAEYKRVTAPALAEYERVAAPAWAEYKRVTAPALAEYEREKAQAFARAYLSM